MSSYSSSYYHKDTLFPTLLHACGSHPRNSDFPAWLLYHLLTSLDNISSKYYCRDQLLGLMLWICPSLFKFLHLFAPRPFYCLSPLYFSSLGTSQHWYIDSCNQRSHDNSFSCPHILKYDIVFSPFHLAGIY